jgi:hypothetical protein
LQILILSLALSASGEDVIYIKSDSTWRASDVVTQTDWFKPEYEPSGWGNSVGLWSNNPCSAYCGKIKSCEVSCRDWMWYGSSCENCTRYFKKAVDVPGEIKSASITISGDDYYWLYVNGNFVGSDENKLNAETYDVSGLLHEGVNIIAVKVENRREYEGVVVSGEIVYTGANKVITQLQEQVKTLEAQIATLTEDKRILQQRADSQDRELQARNTEVRTLEKTLEEFKLANQSATSEIRSLRAELGDCKEKAKVLEVALVVLVVVVVIVWNHVYENYIKKKKPRLSAVPVEKEEHKKQHKESK